MKLSQLVASNKRYTVTSKNQAQDSASIQGVAEEDLQGITGSFVVTDQYGDVESILYTEDDNPNDPDSEYDEIDMWLI